MQQAKANEIHRAMAVPDLPARAPTAHKGTCGRVLVVAGSRGMSGAAVLCGSAALRAGAGLVTVACPESIADVVAAGNPCLMTLPLAEVDGHVGILAAQLLTTLPPRADVAVVGPGLGQWETVAQLVAELVRSSKIPLVLDADALNVLDLATWQSTPISRVLTPHVGEFARLTGRSITEIETNREEMTVEFARRFGVVLVLKGHQTLVSNGAVLYRNTTGNPGMATAGSGDVLAGVIAALVGQGLEPFEAAVLGVYLHGTAGDFAREALGEWSLTALDLLGYLPRAFLAHAISK